MTGSLCSERFVNKTDDYAGDNPLDQVSRRLSHSEFRPDLKVHVVVQHIAHREDANEKTQARAFGYARSA